MNEDPILFKYLLNSGFLCICEDQIETKFSNSIKAEEEHLKNILNEKQMKAVKHFKWDILGHMFNIRDIECFKMLYLGIKLGMEVSDFCHKEAEEEVIGEN